MSRFVIIGYPRAGTTLLSRLLGAHPDVSAPPETGLMTAAARFLSEQTEVEGPPIGVLTGLSFSGIEPEDVRAALREMVFSFHERIAGGRPIWVDKTGTDIFHLETLAELLSGHVRFICIVRNPLDIVASNMDLAAAMGARLKELFEATRRYNNPVEGFARSVADRHEALDRFVADQGDQAHLVQYEKLVQEPHAEIRRLLDFVGIEADADELVARALGDDAPIGLGDFKIDGTRTLRPPQKNGWRKRLPPGSPARIIPILAPWMEKHGYDVPKAPKSPTREDAVRQFTFAAQMKRRAAEQE